MKVIRSKITGYCLGVEKTIENAVDVLHLASEKNLAAYSIGNLIHNEDVIKGFEDQGLVVIKDSDVKPGVALVRAHGLPDAVKQEYIDKKFIVVDSTCTNILKSQKGILEAHSDNRAVIVVGTENHDETNTLLGTGDFEKYPVFDVADLDALYEKLSKNCPVSVVVQTTFSELMFASISQSLKEHFSDIKFINNLCPSCLIRKKDAVELTKACEAIVVVGCSSSANTKELASYVAKENKPVFLVPNVEGLKEIKDSLKKFKTVGVCSGTSAPLRVVDEICLYLENL